MGHYIQLQLRREFIMQYMFFLKNSTTCRDEIINVNQWGEDHFLKFGLI